ncbi:MAG: SDR family NAD(P)-dependent oxidoreductase [Phreatobacter sp.]|uniref:SDR family NAD(P)-dependent oxidoreductase n=1 Tax=Phreatobacter sp. TaxID=1966341 RepID=UPI001A5C8DCF|nr:SDR family NAD(P)-dependent oxidoreductase [Phreatobacter sp.]MBL8568340.1 SDR family NAD(P)-dependent oxidoreductase [Phreatobacter sp.]
MTDKPLSGRIACVTGASRGIGKATALALSAAGAHVIAVARTQGGLEALDDAIKSAGGEAATLVPLDIRDGDGLDRLGLAIHERWGRLDVLVANGAILGPISPLGHVVPKEWDQVVAVNLTAQWRLIRSLDPLLQQSDTGRAVFVTSGAATSCKPFWGPYSATKAALDALARTYAAETEQTPIRVNLFNPGPIRTTMRAQAMPGEDPQTLEAPEAPAAAILSMCLPSMTETGRLYDYPARAWKDFQRPV